MSISLPRPLRIVIPGGTGYLGVLLARHFHAQGHNVSAITRFPRPRDWEAVHWDAAHLGDWATCLEGADVVINLAGRAIHRPYTKPSKEAIIRSRVRTTELMGEAIGNCSRPPRVWLNASSIDIYPNAQDVEIDESWNSAMRAPSAGFSSEVAEAWESAARSCRTPNTRKVLLRLAPVLSPDRGGTFDRYLRLVRWGFGGEMGSGEQYVAWVHDFDFIRAIEFLIEQVEIEGAVNVTAPCPLPNHQFMCNLRRAWCTSYFGLPAPKWLVEFVSLAIQSEAERVLKSRRVIPGRLLETGFQFHFPAWRGACENLVERWRASQSA